MIETVAWAGGLGALVGVLMLLSARAWGDDPSRTRVLGFLLLGILASVVAMMVFGAMGAPETAVAASAPVLMGVSAAVVIKERRAHPASFRR